MHSIMSIPGWENVLVRRVEQAEDKLCLHMEGGRHGYEPVLQSGCPRSAGPAGHHRRPVPLLPVHPPGARPCPKTDPVGLGGYDRKKCKRKRHVFHKNSENLTDHERWYLDRYLEKDGDLKETYGLKEAFKRWFAAARENG